MAYRRKSEKRDKRPERGGIYPQSIISGICMICMCVVGGSGDESGADSNIEEEHKPEA